MKLNHLNLTVDDVPAAPRFLEKHFGRRPYGEGQRNFDVLFDDDDLVLTIGVRPERTTGPAVALVARGCVALPRGSRFGVPPLTGRARWPQSQPVLHATPFTPVAPRASRAVADGHRL
jgi:hypothetical protein